MISNNSSPRRVVVGVVTDTGTVDLCFAQSLCDSIKVASMMGVDIVPIFMRSKGNATMRYNQLLTWAWKGGTDDLVFISPNCSWQPQAFMDTLLSANDAVTLPVFTQDGYQVQMGELPRLQTDANSGEIKVLGAGLGFFRLSKKILTKLCETHPTIEFEGDEVKLVLQHGDIYGAFVRPADILVHRLKELGVELWLNPKHTVNTMTFAPLEGNFAAALAEAKRA